MELVAVLIFIQIGEVDFFFSIVSYCIFSFFTMRFYFRNDTLESGGVDRVFEFLCWIKALVFGVLLYLILGIIQASFR